MEELTVSPGLLSFLDKPVTNAAPSEIARHAQALTRMVLDLMKEVEALRAAVAGEQSYRDSYRAAMLRGHDASGILSPDLKVMQLFYPSKPGNDGRAWRESLMLERLGYSESDIEQFRNTAEDMEDYT